MSKTMRDDAIEHDPSTNMAPIAGRGDAVIDEIGICYIPPGQRQPLQDTINMATRLLLDRGNVTLRNGEPVLPPDWPGEVIRFPLSPEYLESLEVQDLFSDGRPML